jgi:large subunit ribosomal protein L15
MRGGRGKAGRQKHKWTHTIKYRPDYFGKKGFNRHQTRKLATINVGELDEKIESLLSNGLAIKKGKRIILDLIDLGVEKLLGSGKVTRPIFVTAKSWSKNAVRKIEEAEGKIILQT